MAAKQRADLIRGEPALLEKAHLAAAFPEIPGGGGTEPFLPYLFEQFLPARGVELQAIIDQGIVDAALVQFRADPQRPLAALEARMCE